jgi:hypothetical protein
MKVFRVYTPGVNARYIEAYKVNLGDEHIVFTDDSDGVLAVVATLPGLVVVDQENERGTAGFQR